jgi:hypothetical protein
MVWLINHASRALMPPMPGIPGVDKVYGQAFVRQYLSEMDGLSRVGLVLGTLLFVVCPIITIGVPLPSFLLPAAWLDRYANRIVAHPVYLIRQGVSVLKMVAGLSWGSDPQVRRALNLEPYPQDPQTWLHE